MIIRSLLVLLSFSASVASADQIWLPKKQSQIDLSTFEALVSESKLVVVGENHYDPEIIAIEASIVKVLSKKGPTTLGWEFLNLIDAERVAETVAAMKTGKLTAEEGLETFFPNASAVEYKALFEAIATTEADLIPTNLTRAQKTPVTKGGIDQALPSTVPPGFAMGSDAYFELFKEAMGPHPLPSPIENYFASQSLTDDVMAYSLLNAVAERRVLVTGAFHGDYRLGAVERLEARLKDESALYIKVVQKSDYTEEELLTLLNHPTYGPIADIVYLIDSSETDESQEIKGTKEIK